MRRGGKTHLAAEVVVGVVFLAVVWVVARFVTVAYTSTWGTCPERKVFCALKIEAAVQEIKDCYGWCKSDSDEDDADN